MNSFDRIVDTGKPYGLVLLRLVAGWRLIAGAWPYASATKPMNEVKSFFQQLHIPLPELSAYTSVYAQFICGILFIVGWFTRPAALVMVINFLVAIVAAHTGDKIENSFPAWALLAMSVVLLFHGAGKLSIDSFRR